MIKAAYAFLILCLVGLILGTAKMAPVTLEIGQVVLGLFVLLALMGVAIGIFGGGSPRDAT